MQIFVYASNFTFLHSKFMDGVNTYLYIELKTKDCYVRKCSVDGQFDQNVTLHMSSTNNNKVLCEVYYVPL